MVVILLLVMIGQLEQGQKQVTHDSGGFRGGKGGANAPPFGGE